MADILNVKVDIPESEEGPAMGGAMLAAVACGEYASVEEAAAKIVKVVDTVEPIPENAQRYEERYQAVPENLSGGEGAVSDVRICSKDMLRCKDVAQT